MWQCKHCMVQNDDMDSTCACCGEKREAEPVPRPSDDIGQQRQYDDYQNQLQKETWEERYKRLRYDEAIDKMNRAETENEIKKVIEILRNINGYKDADLKRKQCEDRIAKLNDDSKQNDEDQDSGNRAIQDKTKKKTRDWTEFIGCGVFMALLLGGHCYGSGGFAASWKDIGFKIAFIASIVVEAVLFFDTL